MGKIKEKIQIGSGDMLIVIDPNTDFADPRGKLYSSGNPNEVSDGEMILRIFRLAQANFQSIGYSLDSHYEASIEHGIYPKHCIKGTPGQNLFPPLGFLDALCGGVSIIKGEASHLFSLSIAASPRFSDLVKNMRQKSIKRVFLCGWLYTHCVGESAIDLARQGFEVFVIRDCTKSFGESDIMDQKLALYGVKLTNFQDWEEQISRD